MQSLLQDIKKIESIQKYFTKVVCNRCNIQFNSYSDRLQKLNLHSLQYRRVYFDITFMFKIINGTSGLNFSDFFRQRPTTYNLRYNQNNVETIDHFGDNGWLNSFFSKSCQAMEWPTINYYHNYTPRSIQKSSQ